MIKETFLMLAILSVGTVALNQTVYGQTTVQNTLTINNDVCSVDIPNGVDFGSADEDSFSLESDALVLTNDGNVDATVEFYATHWYDDENPSIKILNGENTRFSNTGISGTSFSSKIPSNSTNDDNAVMGTVFVNSNNSTYWQVDTSLVSGQETFQGAIHQDMTFGLVCAE